MEGALLWPDSFATRSTPSPRRLSELPRALSALLALIALTPARAQTIGACPAFPADNIWNAPVDRLPLDPNSAAYVSTIGSTSHLHPDFGSGLWDGSPVGIPYVLVRNQPAVTVHFDYDDESDPGPYPIPPNPPTEGGSDRHILIVDEGTCILYELFAAEQQPNGTWAAGSGAIFDLRANRLRPAGWTSADAAGLPILPGLVRYDEVLAGEIKHAIRFTAPSTRNAYVWPARHLASSRAGPQYPPMGQRFRLRADFDISHFSATNQIILRALKKYGMFLADNGSSWYITGAPDQRWNNDDLHALQNITGAAFEAVDSSSLMITADSAAVRTSSPATPSVAAAVSAASFLPAAAEGAWIAVFGTNLSTTERGWRTSEIVGGVLPTQLEDVTVNVAGHSAAISYISAGQINVQIPDHTQGAAVPLQVSTSRGASSLNIEVRAAAPALFTFPAQNHRYAAAQHSRDYSPAATAQTGEIVIFWGTGFGPTVNPVIPAGVIVANAARFASPVRFFFGTVEAEVTWAGRSGAGLDQLNVRVPAGLASGDHAVSAQINGTSTQANVFLTVAR